MNVRVEAADEEEGKEKIDRLGRVLTEMKKNTF